MIIHDSPTHLIPKHCLPTPSGGRRSARLHKTDNLLKIIYYEETDSERLSNTRITKYASLISHSLFFVPCHTEDPWYFNLTDTSYKIY